MLGNFASGRFVQSDFNIALMASKQEKMATTLAKSDGGGSKDPKPLSVKVPGRGGFFTVYKRGQGYWTRLGTGIGATILIIFISLFVFSQLASLIQDRQPRLGIAAGFTVLAGLLAWGLMNKPKHAQFLIDTDAEMKKINWTTRQELIGATRVIMFFMLGIAALLFIFDTVYHIFFYLLDIWKISPFDPFTGGKPPTP